jgi:hypothetical protein
MAKARPALTPSLCLNIVVNAAPHPTTPPNPADDLFNLGVVDSQATFDHKSNIQAALHAIQFQIAQNDIQSGPGVLVGTCSNSVLGNAH